MMRNCSIGTLLHLKKGNAVKVHFLLLFRLAGDLRLEMKLEINSPFCILVGKVVLFS